MTLTPDYPERDDYSDRDYSDRDVTADEARLDVGLPADDVVSGDADGPADPAGSSAGDVTPATAIQDDGAAVPESGVGTGYDTAEDDRGVAGAGADVSGSAYVRNDDLPAQPDDSEGPGTGTGYASAVDGHGSGGAGEDVSGDDYVSNTEPE